MPSGLIWSIPFQANITLFSAYNFPSYLTLIFFFSAVYLHIKVFTNCVHIFFLVGSKASTCCVYLVASFVPVFLWHDMHMKSVFVLNLLPSSSLTTGWQDMVSKMRSFCCHLTLWNRILCFCGAILNMVTLWANKLFSLLTCDMLYSNPCH